MCGLAGDPPYIWSRNGQNVGQGVNYWAYIQSGDSFSCAVEGYEHLRSPLVYAPKTPSVTVSPSGEIEEGSSVTLSCSSDANPAAEYTWFKDNHLLLWGPSQPLTFPSVRPEDRGTYRCHAKNQYGQLSSNSIFMDVQYAPKTPSVTVSPSGEIEEGSSVTLSCSSDANPVATYTWFRDITDRYSSHMNQGPQLIISYIWSSDSGQYRCDATNKLGKKSFTKSVDVQYAPKTPSVTVSPPGEIKEGSSVTLSCSSDANPAAKYTWFKVDTDRSSRKKNQGPQLVFSYIVSSDSGQYRCKAQNTIGKSYVDNTIDVKYGPKHTFLSSSSSGEIEEGSSVTLSCSSDANPAAEYTWFKNNQPLLWGPSQRHTFPSVRPKDRGTYHCQAGNQYGHLSSNSMFLNVTYAPKTPSVTVSPSGEIEEGSSVTLSCSSDANPAAEYTWFREHEDSVKASGQNYSITNITSELGGNYFCQAHNAIGHHNSTFLLIKVCIQCLKSTSSSWTTTLAVRGIVVSLATVLLLVFLWMRRKRASSKACGQGGRPYTVEELHPVPVYENVSALTNRLAPAAQREPIKEQDGHHCAIIHTSSSDNQDQDQTEMGGTSEL
ncbi:B-cell receptor CD22-like [Gadus morhua]|uniref:B-cell receptor CD22-like n=1 Tax=Gadus morhua TaxID=8049 RepID=UPI0011B70863|nr:B-cell receptor CD22-like [Gadus morhua]